MKTCPITLALGMFTMMTLAPDAWAKERTPKPEGTRLFNQFDIDIGVGERQTVIAGFFQTGPLAELAVLNVESDGTRRIRLFPIRPTDRPARMLQPLDSHVQFVDVLRMGNQDRLVSYQSGRLKWHDLPSQSILGELPIPTCFIPPRKNEIPHVDISHDVNNDGLVDIVLPDHDGFWIISQSQSNTLGLPIKIHRPTDLSGITGADGYRYDPWPHSRIYKADFNQDERSDLVYWRDHQLHVHFQNNQGFFTAEPVPFKSPEAIQTDDIYTLATANKMGKALSSITDLNADGLPDLIVLSIQGRRLSKKQSGFEVYLGKRETSHGIRFDNKPSLRFQTKGKLHIALKFHDYNGDHQKDLAIPCIDRKFLKGSLWKTLKGFMGEDIRLQHEFYRSRDGKFLPHPDAHRSLAIDGVPSPRERGSIPLEIVLRGATHEERNSQLIWPRAFNTLLRLGDVNGDGLTDLIRSSHPSEMGVQLGTPNANVFSEETHRIRVDMPNDEEYVQLLDLNTDGKQDLLLHRPFLQRDAHGGRLLPPSSASQRVTVLLSQ